jgi:hypothetical protein
VSLPVPLDRLRAAVAERPAVAYLLTTSDDGRPHAVHVPIAWDGDHVVTETGSRTAANATARPAVSLLLPVRSDGDYTLIIDGTAEVTSRGDVRHIAITPTKAILHRQASAPRLDAPCQDDCVPLLKSRE